jgi:hypothetical protein
MITKFARLEFELFTKPSKSDFLRVHQIWKGILFIQFPVSFSKQIQQVIEQRKKLSI